MYININKYMSTNRCCISISAYNSGLTSAAVYLENVCVWKVKVTVAVKVDKD